MPVINRFRVLLTCALAITLGIKGFVTASVANPSDDTIALAMAPFFEKNGFEVAGPTTFAGRAALLVGAKACTLYAVPVAHQGWHQATIRHSLTDGQSLWFAFEGDLKKNEQQRWLPLIEYYKDKSLRYFGIGTRYPPVLALVASPSCDLGSIHWSDVPTVPFERV